MILLGIGGNLASKAGPPLETSRAALVLLETRGVRVVECSPWYETAPVPASHQPWYVNAAVRVETSLAPVPLLALLHDVEAQFGRVRGAMGAPRTLDLDLLAYNDLIRADEPPLLPHPRLQERAFVLFPLRDIVPEWEHPVLRKTARELAVNLPPGQQIRLMAGNP